MCARAYLGGRPLREHGGPAGVTPKLYEWKGTTWIRKSNYSQ